MTRTIGIFGMAAMTAVAALGGTAAANSDQLARGKYLAAIMDCGGCHTPGALRGEPDFARYLGGSDIGFEMPGVGIFYPPNLTPHPETGLGAWSEADIIQAVTKGTRPDGRHLAPVMPWHAYAALTPEDANALAAFLKTLPVVEHAVPLPVGADGQAVAPYLGPKMPN